MANQFQKPDYNADLFLPRRKFFHKARRCDISCAVARVQTEIPKVVGKLSGGEPLGIDQLLEYLAALKEVARAQLDNWPKGAEVGSSMDHRFWCTSEITVSRYANF